MHPGDMGFKWHANTGKQVKIMYSEAKVASDPIYQEKEEEQRCRNDSFFFYVDLW